MKKIFNLFTSILLILTFNISVAFANNKSSGPAGVFKVTMTKMELCTGYQGGTFSDLTTTAFCNDAVVIGSGEKTVDIASVGAGSAVASYGDSALLPLGETYTHVRVTMLKKFTIQTESPINTGGTSKTDSCVTTTLTDSAYPTNIATDKYTHRPAVAEGGTPGERDIYMINGHRKLETQENYTQCFNAGCDGGQLNANWNTDYPANASHLTSAIAQSTPSAGDGTDEMIMVYALSKPYTVALIPPKIDMAFGTRTAIVAQEVCNSGGSTCSEGDADGMCNFYIEEPQVTLTIQ